MSGGMKTTGRVSGSPGYYREGGGRPHHVDAPFSLICEVCRVAVPARLLEESRDDRTGAGPLVVNAWVLYADHGCEADGRQVDNMSRLPGWHPFHVCGMFCDGQDGSNSTCAREKASGPPSIIDTIGDLSR